MCVRGSDIKGGEESEKKREMDKLRYKIQFYNFSFLLFDHYFHMDAILMATVGMLKTL